MANMTTTPPAATGQRRSPQRASSPGIRWKSERQLEAYLQARDVLRRVRAVASLAPEPRRDAASPPSAS